MNRCKHCQEDIPDNCFYCHKHSNLSPHCTVRNCIQSRVGASYMCRHHTEKYDAKAPEDVKYGSKEKFMNWISNLG